ncbi:hypothetical protein FEM48_Zijuj02G0126900 [Ziziphus jujuba var. spinosa]|uniref:Retrovirus-related Pol polyprotein from transposon TNT 1-94 n=1 Tax=Ziziphus jujuba var. spinosa TaxID=714518 RepID=A0A978VVS9_ZIZJJ|nr:hypothetical protein FEM48_Zijuj02G0126900 [Ziziphus jujuba var. spinosa]
MATDNFVQPVIPRFDGHYDQWRESVTDFSSWTMAIINKMRIHGDKKEDVTIVEKILRSMTRKFNFVVCSIEEANDIEELSIDES